MSTYNGEPYSGFFKLHTETFEQYKARQPVSVSYKGKVVEPDLNAFDEELINLEHGLPADTVLMWDGDNNSVSAQWVEPYTGELAELRMEVAELRDTLKRTEDFVNSMLKNKTVEADIEMTVTKTPVNIPAKQIDEDSRRISLGVKSGRAKAMQIANELSPLRTFKPKKVVCDEDYERAMSLVKHD